MNTTFVVKKQMTVGREPVVVLPLKRWNAMENELEELEERLRYFNAYRVSVKKKGMSLDRLRAKYHLR